jgi:hypothetical protein
MVIEMGIFQEMIDKKDEIFSTEQILRPQKTGAKNKGDADSYLVNEIDRLEQYIGPQNLKRIIDVKSAVKYGVMHIGDIKDCDFFDALKYNSSDKAKKQAARALVMRYAEENLKSTIVTKSGKEVFGRMVSKNVYLHKVSYINKAGKNIGYLQAKNKLTGKIVSLKTAKSLIGRYG